jgi:hypothetical protein
MRLGLLSILPVLPLLLLVIPLADLFRAISALLF